MLTIIHNTSKSKHICKNLWSWNQIDEFSDWRWSLQKNIKWYLEWSQQTHQTQILKTIKAYRDEVTDFHNNEMPKVESNYICLAVKGD